MSPETKFCASFPHKINVWADVIQIACIRHSNSDSGTVLTATQTAVQSLLKIRQIRQHNTKTSDNTSQKTKINQLLLFRGVYMVLVGKPEGKRPLGIPRRRWEDNIKMDL